ncbi:MAG TPA: dihydrolipoamide acetyltransferase family protein [Dongiaceae bacterium]|nr:dihydrolipoamide acetyltransferase family protein [Dongiaceae bacterium]
MAIEIIMPKLSDTMTEGLFAGWKKSVGDRIERGDVIAEVETDKAVMDLEAFASGILIKTMVHGGENVQVGTVLGLIGEAGEMAASAASGQPVSPAAAAVSQAAEAAPRQEAPPETAVAAAIHPEMDHEKASPLVRRLAREQGIDLERVTGSGPEGRITQDDLVSLAGQQPGKPEAAAPSAAAETGVSAEGAPATPMRRAIAATVAESWQTIPHFSVTVEIDMEACSEIVRELKEGPDPVGYNALVIKACARALLKFPLLRSGDPGSSSDININFAVSKPDGLLMPVIRRCQSLSVAEIESESSRLADKSRAGRLTSEEMSGGSFSVSNLGMYGVDEFTALIMPGQTGILAVGAVVKRPVVRSGQLAVAATMRVTLSSDHRTVDGAYAASFLAELRSSLEKPVSLLM